MNRLSRVNNAICGYELAVMDRKGGTPAWRSGEQQGNSQTEERTSLLGNFTPNLRFRLYNNDNDLSGYVKTSSIQNSWANITFLRQCLLIAD